MVNEIGEDIPEPGGQKESCHWLLACELDDRPSRGAPLPIKGRRGLFERRWPEGFVCPACGNGRAASLKSRAHTYECLSCRRQTSVTAGTVMHRSKLPLTVWFWAAHLMATHSNGMSALQFEAQLGITYKTAWLLAQKLRRSMIDPQREPLEGVLFIAAPQVFAVPMIQRRINTHFSEICRFLPRLTRCSRQPI